MDLITLALSKDYTDKQIEKIQLGGIDSETIKQAVDEYITKNPVNETDPTVPEWAKQPNKPTYTAAEVGAMPADAVLPSGGGAVSFPAAPQFDITVEEDCASILLETLDNKPLQQYNFESMYIAVNSVALIESMNGALMVRVNHKTNGTVHPTASVDNFIRQTASKWWHALFDFKNENVYWCAGAAARAIDAVTSFKRPACYRKGASATMPISNIYVGGTSTCLIPAGTKIYIWLR